MVEYAIPGAFSTFVCGPEIQETCWMAMKTVSIYLKFISFLVGNIHKTEWKIEENGEIN